MERRVGPFFGVLVSLVGGALLMIAVVVFVFYGYCEDSCDKPPRDAWEAFLAALPWALGAIGLMWAPAYLFAFAALFLGDHQGLAWLFGVPAVLAWEWLTAMVARRFARTLP